MHINAIVPRQTFWLILLIGLAPLTLAGSETTGAELNKKDFELVIIVLYKLFAAATLEELVSLIATHSFNEDTLAGLRDLINQGIGSKTPRDVAEVLASTIEPDTVDGISAGKNLVFRIGKHRYTYRVTDRDALKIHMTHDEIFIPEVLQAYLAAAPTKAAPGKLPSAFSSKGSKICRVIERKNSEETPLISEKDRYFIPALKVFMVAGSATFGTCLAVIASGALSPEYTPTLEATLLQTLGLLITLGCVFLITAYA